MSNCGLHATLYASESCLSISAAQSEVVNLVKAAQRRNATLAITGGLLFTGERFAQYVEGPAAAVRMLITSIANDVRHKNMLVIFDKRITDRLFAGCSLAYTGPSIYKSKLLEATVASNGSEREHNVHRLLRLLAGLARPLHVDEEKLRVAAHLNLPV